MPASAVRCASSSSTTRTRGRSVSIPLHCDSLAGRRAIIFCDGSPAVPQGGKVRIPAVLAVGACVWRAVVLLSTRSDLLGGGSDSLHSGGVCGHPPHPAPHDEDHHFERSSAL